MNQCKVFRVLFAVVSVFVLSRLVGRAQEKGTRGTAQVHVVITASGLQSDRELPHLKQDEVKVKQDGTFLQVTQLIPAHGDNAALQLISEISQRYNVLVSSIYSPGVGRDGRSSWDLQLGLGGLCKIAQETGGECYSLGTSALVSFKPYLEQFQKALGNQYYLVFLATPRNKAGLQGIRIDTETSNAEILAPDNVWVEAAK